VGAIRRREIANQIRKNLLSALRLRVYPDEYGAVHLTLDSSLVAVVVPSFEGGWDVLTVYTADEKEWVG